MAVEEVFFGESTWDERDDVGGVEERGGGGGEGR